MLEMLWCIKINKSKKNYFASMWIRTSEPCSALTHMRAKLSFTIAILLRQYMMELLNCHLLLFTLVPDGLTGTQLTYQSKPIQLVTLEFFHRCEHHSQQSIFEKKVINSENNSFHIFYFTGKTSSSKFLNQQYRYHSKYTKYV